MNDTYDVIIVGGGLAGSSTATVLGQAGLDVLVLERETEFRDRVRGEWLAPWGILEAEALGIRDIIDSIPHANLITRHVGYDETLTPDEAEAGVVDFLAIGIGGCLGVGHPQLQEALLTHAAEQSATVKRGTSPARVTPGVTPTVTYSLDGVDHTATARLVVAADGRESGIRKSLGIELHSTEPHVIMAGMLVDGIHDWSTCRSSGTRRVGRRVWRGMSVAFRDVHMITDAITATDDRSMSIFDAYHDERRERMRRLRFASAGSYLINGFGPDARARRVRLREKFAADPMSSPVVTAFAGAWVLPEAAYSDDAWNALAAV